MKDNKNIGLWDVLGSLGQLTGVPDKHIKRHQYQDPYNRNMFVNTYTIEFFGPVPVSYYNNSGEAFYGCIVIDSKYERLKDGTTKDTFDYSVVVEDPPYGAMVTVKSRKDFEEKDLKDILREVTKVYKAQYERLKSDYGSVKSCEISKS